MFSFVGRLVTVLVSIPLRVIKWMIELIISSVIRVIVFIFVIVLFGYVGLDLLGVIDSPYLEPIKSGFERGKN